MKLTNLYSIAKDDTAIDNTSTESFSSSISKKQDEISPYSASSLNIPTSLPVAQVSERKECYLYYFILFVNFFFLVPF